MRSPPLLFVQHGLIQIRCDDGNVLQGCQGPRHYASACGDFQDPGYAQGADPLPDIHRVGLEDQRHKTGFMELWNRPGEGLVGVGHWWLRTLIGARWMAASNSNGLFFAYVSWNTCAAVGPRLIDEVEGHDIPTM